MKQIPLTNGGFTQVDDKDYQVLKDFKWAITKRYVYKTKPFQLKGEKRMHRIIMKAQKGQEVDHIDGNPLNNQRSNLRLCSKAQNRANRKLNANNKSGYKGVSWHIPTQKWLAHIKHNYKTYHLGLFLNKHEAAAVYNKYAIKFHGLYARLNPKGGDNSEKQSK